MFSRSSLLRFVSALLYADLKTKAAQKRGNMSKVNGYSAYQTSYTSSAVQSRKDAVKADKTTSAQKSENGRETGTSRLSDAAKAMLKDLQKQYGNMDFIVAKYETEEEAASYLSRGSKEFSVLIDPDELEAMANDSEVRKQYTDQLDRAVEQLQSMKEQIQLEEGEVLHLGVSIDKDGVMSFFADIAKSNAKLHEKQAASRAKTQAAYEARMTKRAEKKKAEQKAAEKKAEKAETEQKAAEKKAEKAKNEQLAAEKLETQDGTAVQTVQRVRVSGSTAEELLENIRNVDWSQVPSQELTVQGGRIDFSA